MRAHACQALLNTGDLRLFDTWAVGPGGWRVVPGVVPAGCDSHSPRGGRLRFFHDRRDAARLQLHAQASGRRRVSPFCRPPGARRTPPGAVSPLGPPPVRAGRYTVRAVCSRRRAVDKCSGSAGNADRPERNGEIFAWNGAGFASIRTGPRPDLPSLMANYMPATGARRCIPGPGPIDIGVASIDFSTTASRPGPREYRRPRPLLPASRPPRWRPASGSGRFPSRSRLISTRVPAPRPRSNGAPCPTSWPAFGHSRHAEHTAGLASRAAPDTDSGRMRGLQGDTVRAVAAPAGRLPGGSRLAGPAATAYHRWLILSPEAASPTPAREVFHSRTVAVERAPAGHPSPSARPFPLGCRPGFGGNPLSRPVWVSRPDASAARPAAPGRSGSVPPTLHCDPR